MQPIIYRRTVSKLQTEKNAMLLMSAVWTALSLVGLADLLWGAGLFLVVISPIMAAFCIASFMRYSRHGSPADNFLRFDDDGFTHGSWGEARHWRWSELSDFELRGGKKFWFWPPFRYVPIAKRGETGWMRFLLRWGREPTGIVDSYGAPLEEIAAKLNDYRKQALA